MILWWLFDLGSDILNNIGNFYIETNQSEKALEYFNMTLELCKKTGDQYLTALCKRKIGVLLIEKGSEDDGISFINESLSIGEEIDNLELIKFAYHELFNHYNKKGNIRSTTI